MKYLRMMIISSLCFVLVACADDSPDKAGNNGSNNGGTNNGGANNGGTNNGGTNNGGTNNGGTNNGTTNTNNGTTNTNNGTTNTNNGTTNTNNGTNGCMIDETDPGTHDSCSDGGYTSCTWNGDCADGERCEDVGTTPDTGVTCCVPGCPGTKAVGEQCSSKGDCESGMCIGRNADPEVCSTKCETKAECPDDMECKSIPFVGEAGDMWCVTAG